ncbi:hypothetical protein IWQ61_006437 [Dispira simplex]|nr:hypothetical protein IWQ61_006437 [Dispira simplex]
MSTSLISPAERGYIREGISTGIRSDGRNRQDFRDYIVNLDVISHSNGSARCRIGYGTDVLVGIKAETMLLDPTQPPNQGKVICHVECSPSVVRRWDQRTADDLNNNLTQFLTRCLNQYGGIDLGRMCIIPGKACWVLYVDALVLDFDGNLHDALLLAVRGALFNTRIPELNVQEVDEGEFDFEANSDPEAAQPVPGWEKVPLCVTLNRCGEHYFVDATATEEQCTEAKLSVVINHQGEICAVQKGALGAIPHQMYTNMVQSAAHLVTQLLPALDERLQKEAKSNLAHQNGKHISTFIRKNFH